MAWPPPTLPTNRDNTTAQFDIHKDDHNAIGAAINDTTAEITANNAAFVRGGPGPTQMIGQVAIELDTPVVPVLRDLTQNKYGATGEMPSASFARSGGIPEDTSTIINLATDGTWAQIGTAVSLDAAGGKTGQRYLCIGQVHCINNQGGNPVPANFPTDGDDCRIEVSFSYDLSQTQPPLGALEPVRPPTSAFQSRMWPWSEATIACVYGMALETDTIPTPTFRMWARQAVWAGGAALAQVDLKGCSLQVLELGRSA